MDRSSVDKLQLISDSSEAADELRALLPGIELFARLAEALPAEDIGDVARRAAAEAYFGSGIPTLALLTDTYFDAPTSGYAPLPKFSERELEDFAAMHDGKAGVMRIVSAFTEEGVSFHADQRDVPGRISARPRGNRGTQLDRVWIPSGYQHTVSELMESQPRLNRRERAYRVVGARLGVATAQDIYEVHITVEMPAGHTYPMFQSACRAVGVKAIHIELEAGVTYTHFITGSVHTGDLSKVEGEAIVLEQRLRESGLRPVRRKIEAMIQNSLAPIDQTAAYGRPRSNYFEFHTKVTLQDGDEAASLQHLCRTLGVHLARSASNRLEGRKTQKFITARFHQKGRLEAEAKFGVLIEQLRLLGYQPSHILKEYVVVDTNLELDAGWADSALPALATVGDAGRGSTSTRTEEGTASQTTGQTIEHGT